MRRVYTMNPKRKQLQQDMLLAMRQARRHISPELLEQAREAIIRAREHAQGEASLMYDDAIPAVTNDKFEAVDRAKNLSIIMQYMEMMRDNPAQYQSVRGLLKDSIQ